MTSTIIRTNKGFITVRVMSKNAELIFGDGEKYIPLTKKEGEFLQGIFCEVINIQNQLNDNEDIKRKLASVMEWAAATRN